MFLAMLATAMLAATGSASVSSEEGAALVATVQTALDEVRRRQAMLPPPRDDAERIVWLGEFDQAPRTVVTKFDWSRIPAGDRDAALRAVGAAIDASEHANLTQLLRMLPSEGWFLKSRYGSDAAKAAFLIVQHADLGTQRRFLPKLEALAKTGEVEGEYVAGMSDRIAVSEGRPQRYGTQFRCDAGKWRPYPLKDGDQVEKLRREVGIRVTFAQTGAFFRAQPSCPQTSTPPPPGMKLD
jgi:hypothetical protein